MALDSIHKDPAGFISSLFLAWMCERISLIMVNVDPFSHQANFISRLFAIGFLMLEVNSLYFLGYDYEERDWVIFNCIFLGLMFLSSVGSFTLI